MKIQIPYNFVPRPYQLPILKARDEGFKRLIAVWHRRAGKDKTFINLLLKEAMKRKGAYYYFLPTYTQAKKVIWEGQDDDGFKFMDHIPEQLRTKTNSTEMKIELINGSIIRLIGSDKFDAVRGTNPVGCIFSEFAFQNPQCWNVVSPILVNNGGWAFFNSTPNGRNHFYSLIEKIKDNSEWFVDIVTVDDSRDNKGNLIIPPSAIDEERRSGKDEEFIQQEYYCSFNSAVQGYYWLEQMVDANKEDRIGRVPHDPKLPVYTWSDIGVNDDTVFWFFQFPGGRVNVIDYYENNRKGADYYAKMLVEGHRSKYIYAEHWLPSQDGNKMEWGSGKTTGEMAKSLFPGKVKQCSKHSVQDSINAARAVLPVCRFDEVRCEKGIQCLENFQREFDDKKRSYKKTPLEDWTVHAADAFKDFAINCKDVTVRRVGRALAKRAYEERQMLARRERKNRRKRWKTK